MLILGDSHAMALETAARQEGATVFGGRMAGGWQLNRDFHRRTDQDIHFLDDQVEARYRTALQEIGVERIAEVRCPVLCLFGMNIHYLVRSAIWAGFAVSPDEAGQFLSRAVVRHSVLAMIDGALQFYRDLIDMGLAVYSTLPPRRLHANAVDSPPSLFPVIEEIILEEIRAIGVPVVDHRHWSLDADGRLKAEFHHPDPDDSVHASATFGSILLRTVRDLADRHS